MLEHVIMAVTVPIDEGVLALLLRTSGCVSQILTGIFFCNILLSNQIDCDYTKIICQYSLKVILFRNLD